MFGWIKKAMANVVLKNAIGDILKETGVAKYFEGKKTKITMVVLIAYGVLETWNGYCGVVNQDWCTNIVLPEWIPIVLGLLGFQFRNMAKPK
jgi:hypothetical protein